MESGITEPPPSDQSTEGTMLHGLVADPTKSRTHLTGPQLDAVEQAESIGTEWVQSIRDAHNLGEPQLVIEQEFWTHDGVRPLYPSHPDWVAVWPGVVAVRDYKFGFDPVTDAASNYQLRSYLVALAEEYEADHWYGAIIQPRLNPPFHSVVYTRATLEAARQEILEICRATMAPNAQRRPHPDACRYCRGLLTAHCPDVRLSPAVLATQWAQRIPPSDQLARLTPDDRTRIFDMLEVAQRIINVLWAAGEAEMGKDPSFIPGYELTAGAPRSPINNPTEVWSRCETRGVPILEFMRATTVKKGDLTDVVRASTGLKGKGLENEMDLILKGCTDLNPVKSTLKRKK
jgi:hypothetical protein